MGVRVGFGVKVSAGVWVLVATGIIVIPIEIVGDGVISGVWMDASCSVVEVGSLPEPSGWYKKNIVMIITIINTAPKIPKRIICREGIPFSLSVDD